MMFESESPASDLDLQSFKSLNVEDVLSELLSSESWHLVFRSSSFNVDDTHRSFLVIRVLLSLIRCSLPSDDFFRTSSPRKLETFSQNILSSGFSGTWFFRADVDSCRLLLLPGSFLATDLQNFNPLEARDVHSELLVFSLLRRLVL